MAKIVYNFGLAECSRVKMNWYTFMGKNSAIFVSPAKQKPDICTAFPAASAAA